MARGLLSSCVARDPERVGSVLCGARALSLRCLSSVVEARGLSCPKACGILVPRPGIEPASPASLEGGFFTTGPPEKSLPPTFVNKVLLQRSHPFVHLESVVVFSVQRQSGVAAQRPCISLLGLP